MSTNLAIYGGAPVRQSLLPYAQQWLNDDDIEAVTDVLRSDWLTTGPNVGLFEEVFAEFVRTKEAVAVSNGTAALHAAMFALGIGPGDEVIVPAMTFAASANCVVYQGGTPVFVDVTPGTLLIDPSAIEAKITPKTRAIITVDYAGQPCEYDPLRDVATRYDLALVDDACHAIGGSYKEHAVGRLADLNTFSLHPAKHLTTGEGGVITTSNSEFAQRMRVFRNHGITTDHRQRAEQGSWFYEMVDLGYNYRITDFQCALGMSQLQRLPEWVVRRQEIAKVYDEAFSSLSCVSPLDVRSDISHAYHLYVIRFNPAQLRVDRNTLFQALRAEGIGVNVHYIPIHLHPYYRDRHNTGPGLCPVAELAYEQIISLPMFPRMTNEDVQDVIEALYKVVGAYAA